MTHIRNAQGNNLTEVLSDTINQVTNQFSEGINSMFSGFKSMSQNFNTGFATPNGQQTSNVPDGSIKLPPDGPPTSDEISAGMKASEIQMQAKEVDFFGGPEDTRAVSQTKQVGSQ